MGKLLIAIPALDEEDSIEEIITRSLAARTKIIAESPIEEVEITVVSDGSTDSTVELASRYLDHIKLIVFQQNKGYGAAIKEAWAQSDAEFLGFLDADGTCDPEFFAPLCSTLEKEQADAVLGCRLTPESKMPMIRRMGNNLFAFLLTLFSSSQIRDSASGMRVVRRDSLPKLFPLPDGLHFTPAMSARAILSPDLKIIESPMTYQERKGESKLKVAKDGVRFLKVILQAAFLHRPSRPLGLLGILFLAAGAGLMIMPTLYYLENRSVQEWMIYRFVVGNLAGTSGVLLVCVSYLSARLVYFVLPSGPSTTATQRILRRFFSGSAVWILSFLSLFMGAVLVIPSFLELVTTGATYEHWSRFIAMSFFSSAALLLIITRLFDYVLGLVEDRLGYLKSLAIKNPQQSDHMKL